jgi:hypothetical protein
MNRDIFVSVGDELRRRVRHRIAEGSLPSRVVNDLYAGFGNNDVCSACGDAITPQQVEYELTDPRNARRIVMHLYCHRLWLVECGSRNRAAVS